MNNNPPIKDVKTTLNSYAKRIEKLANEAHQYAQEYCNVEFNLYQAHPDNTGYDPNNPWHCYWTGKLS